MKSGFLMALMKFPVLFWRISDFFYKHLRFQPAYLNSGGHYNYVGYNEYFVRQEFHILSAKQVALKDIQIDDKFSWNFETWIRCLRFDNNQPYYKVVFLSDFIVVYRWSGPTEEQRKMAVANWKRMIEIAVDMGVPVINTKLSGDPVASI